MTKGIAANRVLISRGTALFATGLVNRTLNVLMLVHPSEMIRDWRLSGLGLPLPPR